MLLDEGKISLDFRYRYEFVDQDGFDEEANANTLRTRLGFQSGNWRGIDFNIEFNDVREITDDYNAGGGTTPGRTEYPVVADPKGTRLNQGYVNYTGIEDWGFKVGRQRMNLDNQRFVGSVGWRQTEQVFDTGQVSWGTDAAYVAVTYVEDVQRIYGPNSDIGSDDQDGTVFVNGGLNTPVGKLVGYYYHIEDEDSASFSSDSVGVRLAGNWKMSDDWALRYEAEYAHQNDAGNNPVDFSADYFHANASAVTGILDFGLGWELLGGDADTVANEAFRTPFATLHKFNGWADQFLTTPAAGLSDFYLTVNAKPGKFLFQAQYHAFEADDGGAEYGDEIDLQAGYGFTKRLRADFFLAEFNGRNGFSDVTKVWLQALFTL
ncbi:MAG: alginate export family protein [Pseudomonadales bacterium]